MTAQYRWSCLRKQWHWSKWKSTSIKWQWKWNQQQQWSFSKFLIRSKTLNLSDVVLAVEDWQSTACRSFLQSLYFSLLSIIVYYSLYSTQVIADIPQANIVDAALHSHFGWFVIHSWRHKHFYNGHGEMKRLALWSRTQSVLRHCESRALIIMNTFTQGNCK